MKRLPLLVSCIVVISLASPLSLASAISPDMAAKTPGSKCTKVGAVAKTHTVKVKCVKNGKKLIWRKVLKRTMPRPTHSQSPRTTPTAGQTQTNAAITAQDEYEVNVTARAWSWSFSYQINGSKSPRSSDPSHASVLFIPQGKPVHINLKSIDVSHGFWVPGLGIDREAAPDSVARIDITADKTGAFSGACNIQCGRGHTGMKLLIQVVPETEYLKYLASLK